LKGRSVTVACLEGGSVVAPVDLPVLLVLSFRWHRICGVRGYSYGLAVG
jgi:hypothetical protein